MRYRPARRFIIEPSLPSASVAQTRPLDAPGEKPAASPDKHPTPADQRPANSEAPRVLPASFSAAGDREKAPARDPSAELEALLKRQRRAPLPAMYGETPGVAPPGKQILKTGVSEVIDQGKEVMVCFP
jgi:hypothetical protein